MTVLKVAGVSFSYDCTCTWDINKMFKGGTIYEVIGKNGTGKSTVARIITGIEQISTGHISFNRKNIKEMSIAEKRNTFFYIPQEPYWSFIGETFCDNIAFFNITIKDQIKTPIFGLEDKLNGLKSSSVFSMSSEDVYLLALYEAFVWERPVLFIDECPDFDDKVSKLFLLDLLQQRNGKKLITFISSHLKLELPGVNTLTNDISEFLNRK